MPKATFNLSNGTTVTIEGESTEIEKILDYYSNSQVPNKMVSHTKEDKSHREDLAQNLSTDTQIEYSEIIKFVKNCDEAELIEKQILKPLNNDKLFEIYVVIKLLKLLDNAKGELELGLFKPGQNYTARYIDNDLEICVLYQKMPFIG